MTLSTHVESNSLRQRQVVAVVDRAGLPAHVGFPGIAARFAAAAGSFSPPKAPPISAPLVPMFTLAMPQSLPAAREELSRPRSAGR